METEYFPASSLGHPPGFTMSNRKMKIVAEELIKLIDFDSVGSNEAKSKSKTTIKTAKQIPRGVRKFAKRYYTKSFRLDFQGIDEDKRYARYAIQEGTQNHFAQIHIQMDVEHGREKIKEAFLESLEIRDDVRI